MKDARLYPGSTKRAVLAVLVGAALLACHGVFGGFHLLPGGPAETTSGETSSDVAHPADHPVHAAAQAGGHGAGGGAAHAGAEYAAVLLAVFAGVALRLLLNATRRWTVEGVRPSAGVFLASAWVPALARGPDDRALLQVFRL